MLSVLWITIPNFEIFLKSLISKFAIRSSPFSQMAFSRMMPNSTYLRLASKAICIAKSQLVLRKKKIRRFFGEEMYEKSLFSRSHNFVPFKSYQLKFLQQTFLNDLYVQTKFQPNRKLVSEKLPYIPIETLGYV